MGVGYTLGMNTQVRLGRLGLIALVPEVCGL